MYKKNRVENNRKNFRTPIFSSERENSVESKEWKIQNRYIT